MTHNPQTRKPTRPRRWLRGTRTLALALLTAGAILGAHLPLPAARAAVEHVEQETRDILVFRNGQTVEGKILEETATTIRFRGTAHGMSFETTYTIADILEIQRDVAVERPETPPVGERRQRPAPESGRAAQSERRVVGEGGPVVYHAELRGLFARDIAVQSLERIVRDAAKHQPDYLILTLNNDWDASIVGGLREQELLPGDDLRMPYFYDQLFLVEQMAPMLTELMATEWEKRPQVIFYVRRAMGGAAFLPWIGDGIYFHPEARMGGIGYLDWFKMGGDTIVDEKQISLRMGHAEGMAIRGGFDPRLIRAMMMSRYALSYSFQNGRVVLQDGPGGEVLLTRAIEPGKHEDTIDDWVRGTTKDVLTLNAELARILGISKGTVANLNDLLFELGVHRNHVLIDGTSDRILDQWSRSLREAERRYGTLARDFSEIQVQGPTRRERNRLRGQQIRVLEQMRGLMLQYDGVLRWWMIPGGMSIEQINVLIQQIRFAMAADE